MQPKGRRGSPTGHMDVFANRLPVTRSREGWRRADGGLVTALLPALSGSGGTWIGWDGGHVETPSRVEGVDMKLVPVHLSRKQVQDYYYGFANRTLWPLLHEIVEQPVFNRAWWKTYRDVNKMFADAARGEPSLIWVNDYHLMGLPRELRARFPKTPIGFFLHTPFPAPDVFARLPWRSEILEAVLGADLVGFQTSNDKANFLRACERYVSRIDVRGDVAFLEDGRRVLAESFPISIDAGHYAASATGTEVQRELNRLRHQFRDRRVLLGVDRLDYTKGILERLRAIEILLDRRPDLARNIAFIQIAVPSRDDIKEYRELRAEVEREVGRINGRFTEPGYDIPLLYMYRRMAPRRMLAYYRAADVAVVTPLRDGMNLVAKEYVVAQSAGGGSGALVLSEFAGAAHELEQALMCNPHDVDGVAEMIEHALEMPQEERKTRLDAMAATIHRHDVRSWVGDFVGALTEHTVRRFQPRRSRAVE